MNFVFLQNLNVSRDEVEGNIEIRGKQNSPFPKGPVILKVICYIAKQMGQIITLLTNDVQQRSTFRGEQ